MRTALLFLSLVAVTAPALAQTPVVAVKAGQTLRDPSHGRIGQIDRVNADGSVQVIFGERFVTIPASTITVGDTGPTTSMSKKDVMKLR